MDITRAALAALLAATPYAASFACSPPAPLPLVAGPAGATLPYFDASFVAFVGRVVGHSESADGFPQVEVEVLDPWTPRQASGEIVRISVSTWNGCDRPASPAAAFIPTTYPVGTRLRVVGRTARIFDWDIETSVLVLGGVQSDAQRAE
ncbi:hypothetical protein [Lysobacter sp. A3-1-A15]|uniref:hypothetical protein n=1 Tax=Novilysobacter viscosus TaxID=3098602 RepID=UPI002EDB80EE